MASGYTMMDPICLVENQNNQLTINPTALEILDKISQPVVVVAIAGVYRTGKSYLMNRLAGQNHGFRLGSTVRSETKGIWMWCVPHPSKPNHTLVLLDTEGLGDVEKGDSKNDSWIFALAVLLSSMFVYNSMSTINHQALEQLHYVTKLTKLIRTKSSPISAEVDDSAEFVSFFPDFVWVVRDFMLELKLDGRTITEDEYLEHALKLVPGKDPKIQKSNMPREYIRKFFPRRKCFTFDRPTTDRKLLLHMEEVSENQLVCSFQEQSKNFCNYIFTEAKTKTLREGIIVTGNRLGSLAKAYVDAINSGAVLCLENAVTTLAERENSVAMQKAANHYSQQMAQRVSFSTDTLQELLDLHTACEKEAIAIFMENAFKGDNNLFQKKLMAKEVLQSFLQSQAATKESIFQADKALSAGEKALAEHCETAEQAKKQAVEKELQLVRQTLNELQQKMEAQEKIFQENLLQIKKMKTDIKSQRRNQERMLKQNMEMLEEINENVNKLKKDFEKQEDITSKIFNILTSASPAVVTAIFGLLKKAL